jgi:hypothetical protein
LPFGFAVAAAAGSAVSAMSASTNTRNLFTGPPSIPGSQPGT